MLTWVVLLPTASAKVKLYIHTTENRVSATNDDEDGTSLEDSLDPYERRGESKLAFAQVGDMVGPAVGACALHEQKGRGAWSQDKEHTRNRFQSLAPGVLTCVGTGAALDGANVVALVGAVVGRALGAYIQDQVRESVSPKRSRSFRLGG